MAEGNSVGFNSFEEGSKFESRQNDQGSALQHSEMDHTRQTVLNWAKLAWLS